MSGRKKDTSEYAVYKGEEFIDLGTLDELSISLGLKRNTIVWLKNPSGQKRAKEYKNALYVFKIDDKENEE